MVVYKITNRLNGKIYVGATTKTSKERFKKHIHELNCEIKGARPLTIFHKAIEEFGKDNFIVEDLEYCYDEDTLFQREDYWIRKLNSTNPEIEYNNAYGGKSGLKQDSTKQIIRERKLENWKDENFKARALEGLRKGTETVKERAKKNFHPIVCEYCGKVFYGKPYEVTKRRYCSQKCAGRVNMEVAKNASIDAIHEKYNAIHDNIKKYTINWCISNKCLVMSCPYNKIAAVFEPLRYEIEKNFGIKDFRIICESVIGNYSKKSFLKEVQRIVKMYAEQ